MSRELTMIAGTLQRLHASGLLTVSRMADATGLDESTFYKWMSGQHDPAFSRIALLYRHCADPRVRNAILDVMTRGLPLVVITLPESFDVDGDGDVDCDDARAAAVKALRHVADFMEGITMSEQPIGDKLMHSIEGQITEAVMHLIVARNACRFVHENRSSIRRKANPLKIAGAEEEGEVPVGA